LLLSRHFGGFLLPILLFFDIIGHQSNDRFIMISIELYPNPAENPEIVKLVFQCMRNKYTADSDPAGLTFKEVRSIITTHPVTVIKDGDRIVGVVNVNEVHFSLRKRLGLEHEYFNLGMIYIAKKERGNGYASQVVEHFLKIHKNLIYIVHESNKASNKIAVKYFKFFKQQGSFRATEPYNVYKIEQ
jgi:hypothetical protein